MATPRAAMTKTTVPITISVVPLESVKNKRTLLIMLTWPIVAVLILLIFLEEQNSSGSSVNNL